MLKMGTQANCHVMQWRLLSGNIGTAVAGSILMSSGIDSTPTWTTIQNSMAFQLIMFVDSSEFINSAAYKDYQCNLFYTAYVFNQNSSLCRITMPNATINQTVIKIQTTGGMSGSFLPGAAALFSWKEQNATVNSVFYYFSSNHTYILTYCTPYNND